VTVTEIQSPQTYNFGDPEIILDLPFYDYEPSDAQVNLQFTLSGQPSFVKIIGNTISIYSAQPADPGPFSIKILVKDLLSGLSDETSFEL